MNKKVLLSIKPKYADLILSGEKIYEIRRRAWGILDIKTVILYASAPVCMVVGEFELWHYIEKMVHQFTDAEIKAACLTVEEFEKYAGIRSPISDRKATLIKVKAPIRYENPYPLTRRPPQNFCYIH